MESATTRAPDSSRSSTSHRRSSISSASSRPRRWKADRRDCTAETRRLPTRVSTGSSAPTVRAQFRDATIGKTTATLVTVTITLVAWRLLWYRFARYSRCTQRCSAVGVARTARVRDRDVPRRHLPVLPLGHGPRTSPSSSSSLLAGSPRSVALLGRRGPADPVLIALGIVVVLHVGDLVTGAHLQLNTVFGYTPTVGIRLAGIGNPGIGPGERRRAAVRDPARRGAFPAARRRCGYGVLVIDPRRHRRADVGPGLRRRARPRADVGARGGCCVGPPHAGARGRSRSSAFLSATGPGRRTSST